MTAPATSPAATLPSRTVSRALRVLALLGLALGFGLAGGLLLLPFFPSLHQLFRDLLGGRGLPSPNAGVPIACASLVVTPLAIGYAYRRLPPHSARGWVFLGLFAATLLVANLILVAFFPSVREGIEAILGVPFWKIHGLVVLLVSVSLVAVSAVAWWLRPASPRGFVHFGLAVGGILTADLLLVAWYPPFLDALLVLPESFFNPRDIRDGTFGLLALAAGLVALTPALLLIVAWRLRLQSWRWIGGGYLVLAPVLAYLAADDPVIRRPITMEEIAPAFPGAEKGHELLLRYGKNHPLGRGYRAPQRIWENFQAGESLDPAKPDEWLAFLNHHRAAIEADWAELAPVRDWWAELNALDRIGDLTPPRGDAEILAFAPVRSLSQHGCAIASLQALDGHGDEAIATLLPILQVSRKLQPSARTLVRQMICIVIERMSMQTATFVLDHATVSPAARARLIAALAAPGGGVPGAHRLMAIEYVFSLNYALGKPLGTLVVGTASPALRFALNGISPFVFNSRASYNLYGDFVADEQELVANRQFGQLGVRMKQFAEKDARPRFKNFAGALLISSTAPAMSKIAESYWKTQDIRAALLERVTKS